MEIRILGKHLDVTDILKEHMEEKLQKLGKYSHKIVEAQVILKKEKYLYIVEITVLGKDLRVYSEARSEDNFFNAFDTVQEKVLIQLKKKQEKLKDHKARARNGRTGFKSEAFPELLVPPSGKETKSKARIIRDKEALKPKTMSPDDARMLLEVTENPFLAFRNAGTGKLNVIYRRTDGNFGLIETEN